MYVKIRHMYAKYWKVGRHHRFRVVRFSRSGQSVWLDFDGTLVCVPVSITKPVDSP